MSRRLLALAALLAVVGLARLTACGPSGGSVVPEFVSSAMRQAEASRELAILAMEGARSRGLLFYDVEEVFSLAETYYEWASGNLTAGKYYLAKFNFAKAASLYLQVTSICKANIFNTAMATLVVFFIAVASSFTIAALLVERGTWKRLLVSSLSFLLFSYALYCFHPGFAIVLPPGDPLALRKLLFYGSLYVVLFYLVFVEFPSHLAPAPTPERPHFWGAVAMAFHIGGSNARKRRLRSALTLLTIALSVTAFVAFMSISPGFVTTYSLLPRRTSAVNPSVSTDLRRYLTHEYLMLYSELLGSPKIAYLYKSRPIARASTMDRDGWVYLYVLRANGRSFEVHGVLGIVPSAERQVMPIESIIVEGRLMEDGESEAVLISDEASRALGVSVGDAVELRSPITGETVMRLTVVGVFSSRSMEELYDTTGRPYRTYTYRVAEISPSGGISWQLLPSRGAYVIVVSREAAWRLGTYLARVAIPAGSLGEAKRMAEALARYLDLGVSLAHDGESVLVSQISGLRVTGEASLVPIAICYLIIANSMLTSVYERRREFGIYSALGLNPSHIKYLLIAEAALLGITGGGVGYLAGLSLANMIVRWRLLAGLKINVTPLWAVGSLVLSMVLVMLSVIYPAEKASLQVVPSLERRWRFRGNIRRGLVEDLPSRVEAHLIWDFVEFVRRRVEVAFPPYSLYLRSSSRIEERKVARGHRVDVVIIAEIISEIASGAEFRLICERGEGERLYRLRLSVRPLAVAGSRYKWLVYTVTDEIRKAILAWQAIYKPKGKVRRVG